MLVMSYGRELLFLVVVIAGFVLLARWAIVWPWIRKNVLKKKR